MATESGAVPTGEVRSFDAGEWTPGVLLAAKGDQRVSVVIPARDEEATIGGIVAAVREMWVEAVPLVDELVVIDSDSGDATAELARSAGARVHAAGDIRPELGPARGKGEALWKALHVTTGDILVFLDADLIEWGTHFVSGLAAPLLTDPTLRLVKAVYERPLLGADGHEVESGGRVTELVARPLIALHWPQLAGLVQPLAGEWSVRRSAFEAYAVPCGYGVELAALVDTVLAAGPQAIAQVDLGRRAHRHHRHDTLGQMAVQVMAAVETRLGERAAYPGPATVPLRQFDRRGPRWSAWETDVDITERPPARSVAGYLPSSREGGA